ncbi:protein FAM241B-like [Ylistrum balloti]|uniref:protein FAM241B-like n=1 Tax=Ylistrum balloti TaxID=509963 RepID=UPI002905B173|nr:protein FAM241B-like [Ylistrum balloti]XP_060068632.1 protein FAM241B-like [Ylistrum balloti]
MVKILSNGDIVPDNDPRASTGRSSSSSQQPRQRQGFVRHDEAGPQQYGQQVSIFEMANQKLLGLGIPCWNLGQYTVQPIVTVGCLIALMVFGLPGIIFAAVLFFVVNWSQQNVGHQNAHGGQGQPRGDNWGGGGHRLG